MDVEVESSNLENRLTIASPRRRQGSVAHFKLKRHASVWCDLLILLGLLRT